MMAAVAVSNPALSFWHTPVKEKKNPRYLHVLNPRLLQKGDYLDAASKSRTLTTRDATNNRNPHHTVITYLLDIFSSYCFYGPNHYLRRRRLELERAIPSTLSNSSRR